MINETIRFKKLAGLITEAEAPIQSTEDTNLKNALLANKHEDLYNSVIAIPSSQAKAVALGMELIFNNFELAPNGGIVDNVIEYLRNKADGQDTEPVDEVMGSEQDKFDRMIGFIDKTLEAQLPKIKRAVDKSRQMLISDMSIFNMLATNSLTKQAVKDLLDDGFEKQDIVDFFATDFSN